MLNKVNKDSIIYKSLICMLFVFFIFFTFYLNFTNGERSQYQSRFFLDIASNFINFITPTRNLASFEIDSIHFIVRKFIGHFLLFGVDGVLTYLTFDIFCKRDFKFTIIFGAVFSILCEFMQYLAEGRTFSFLDICLDFLSFILIPVLFTIYFTSKNYNVSKDNGIN